MQYSIRLHKSQKNRIRSPSVMSLFSGVCSSQRDGFPSIFYGVHQTPPRDAHQLNTLNSRLSGIIVEMEITINRKPG
jgi:hypothetical protein